MMDGDLSKIGDKLEEQPVVQQQMIKPVKSGKAPLIIMAIAIVCLLGVIGAGIYFYLNQVKCTVSTDSTTDSTVATTAKNYSDDYFSFDYPSQGWSVESGIKEVEGPGVGDHYVSIQTNVFAEDSSWVGPKIGANIIIRDSTRNYSSNTSTWQESIESSLASEVYTDLTNPTVDGQKAYSYSCRYEFEPFLQTVFEKNSKIYEIKLTASEGDFEPYKPIYEMLLGSLAIK